MKKVSSTITGVKDQFGRAITNGDHNVRASDVFIVSGTSQLFNSSTSFGETQWEYKFNVALNKPYSLGVEASDPNPFTFTLTQLAP
ncbi:MAG: hypothetical protein ACRERW_09270 [Pseudomonas sp.]